MSKQQLDDAEKLIKSETFETVYDVEHELGRGRFAIVKRCVHKKTGKKYAAKVVKKSRSNTHGRSGREQLLMEISILHKSTHPKMVRLYDVFETNTELQLILEYAEGGDLHRHCIETDIARTEKEICYLIRQILEATRYLHNEKIVHLDLKPDNILLAKKSEVFPEIRLIDFGLSRSLEGPYSQFDIVGTAEYVSPEVLAFDPIDYGSDMWSIGVVTYVLLSGISPFAGDDVMETYANIGCVEYDFDCEEFDDISDAAIDFIEKLLLRDPKQRMSARESLEHDWIKQLDGGVTTHDVIQAQQAKKEALPDDLMISPMQGDDGVASSSESDTSNDIDVELDITVEDEIKSVVDCQISKGADIHVEEKYKEKDVSKKNEKGVVNDEERKSNVISDEVVAVAEVPPLSKKEVIKADDGKEVDGGIPKKTDTPSKEVNGDIPKRTGTPTSKEVNGDIPKRTGTPTSKEVNGNVQKKPGTAKSSVKDRMDKFTKKPNEPSPLKQERFSKMSSKSFDAEFLSKAKKTDNKINKFDKSSVAHLSEGESPELDRKSRGSPKIKREPREHNGTAEKKVDSSGTDIGFLSKDKKTENKIAASVKSSKLEKSASEEVNCPIPDNDNKQVESSENTADINSTQTEKLDVVKDVDKAMPNKKKSPVPPPSKKPHEEASKPSPPGTKVKPVVIATKIGKFGKPEENSGRQSPSSKATNKFDKKTTANDDSDELRSNLLFKMKSETVDYDSDESNDAIIANISTPLSISVEEPTNHNENNKPMNSKPKSPPPPVAMKPKSPVPGKKEENEVENKPASPASSRQDSPIQRDMSPSKNNRESPILRNVESPTLRNVEYTSEIGKTPKSPPPDVASKPKYKIPKTPPEVASKPPRTKQSDVKSVDETESVVDPNIKEKTEKTIETETEPVPEPQPVAVELPKLTAKVGGGLKFSLNIGGSSKKLTIGPLVSLVAAEPVMKQVGLTSVNPDVEVKKSVEVGPVITTPVISSGYCERIPETPTDENTELKRPSLADTRGKSDSFTRRRTNPGNEDNTHRKTYRRLYVTKVRNSKIYEHDFNIATEAAKIAQRVDKDVLHVEVKLKSTDLRLLP